MTSPIKKLEIHLDHDIDEQYQYEPGEILSGQVVLILSEDMFVKSIVVQIKGEATVGLDTENGKNADSNLTASEIYVDESVSVYDQQTPTVLSKGNHSFPLEYNLPESLPSSFIGKFGSVTYVVKATLKQGNENQMGLGSNITSEPFLVLRRYDLSNMQELKRPRTIKLSKKSACYLIFCNSKIEAEFQVVKIGFLPGDDIVINAQIENNYPSNIKSILAVLLLNSKFHAKNQSRTHSQIVNKKVDSLPVEQGGERVWTDLRLPVPPFIPESNLEGCVLIDIQYVLQFKIEFDDETDVEASIPVVIGTPETDRRHGGKPAWDENEYPISTGNNFILSNDNFKDVDINVDAKDLERFRHPMVDGEMKENILFQDDE